MMDVIYILIGIIGVTLIGGIYFALVKVYREGKVKVQDWEIKVADVGKGAKELKDTAVKTFENLDAYVKTFLIFAGLAVAVEVIMNYFMGRDESERDGKNA